MKNLKRLRKSLGLTQEDVAKSLDVSRTAVTMWETENREPDYALLCKIAENYEVSTDFLIGCGMFSNWNQIMDNKDAIVEAIAKAFPQFDSIQQLADDERNLIRFLPALFAKIEFDGDDILLYPYLPFDDGESAAP